MPGPPETETAGLWPGGPSEPRERALAGSGYGVIRLGLMVALPAIVETVPSDKVNSAS